MGWWVSRVTLYEPPIVGQKYFPLVSNQGGFLSKKDRRTRSYPDTTMVEFEKK